MMNQVGEEIREFVRRADEVKGMFKKDEMRCLYQQANTVFSHSHVVRNSPGRVDRKAHHGADSVIESRKDATS